MPFIISASLRMHTFSAGIYLFKVNNGNTRKMLELCSKLPIKTPERRQWRRNGVFIVNFEQISNNVLMFALSTLNKEIPDSFLSLSTDIRATYPLQVSLALPLGFFVDIELYLSVGSFTRDLWIRYPQFSWKINRSPYH